MSDQLAFVVWGEDDDPPQVFGPFSDEQEAQRRLDAYRGEVSVESLASSGIYLAVVPITTDVPQVL